MSSSSKKTLPPSVPTARERRKGGQKRRGVKVEGAGEIKPREGRERVFEVAKGGRRKLAAMEEIETERPTQRRRSNAWGEEDELCPGWLTGTPAEDNNWETFEDVVDPADVFDPDCDEMDHVQEVRGSRPSYASSDDPMQRFHQLEDNILQETFYLDALPETACCLTCRDKSTVRRQVFAELGLVDPLRGPSAPEEGADPADNSLYRCSTCGVFEECRSCSIARHKLSPLHSARRWNGLYWQRTTLRDMGLKYHIGHDGQKCHRASAEVTCTVLDANGVHQVCTTFCGCSQSIATPRWKQAMRTGWYPSSWEQPQTFATYECLKRFRTLCVVSNMNVQDFVTSLEKMTDPLGSGFLPDRYKNFGRMVRQWYHLVRMRRMGIGHLAGGVSSAPLGSAAVKCWACPRPGVNLPEGWENVQENIRYKYSLFVGLDANFRLENKLRKVAKDKSLHVTADGLGYFAKLDGVDGYIEQLKKHITEEDLQTCSGFQAVMQRDTRFSKGLRATGVAACPCTRHECMRPNGLADTPKGERWSTMDFIFCAAIQNELILRIMASYDIGCTWKVYLLDRLKALPESLGGPKAGTLAEIEVSLPVWHAIGHHSDCAAGETLRNKPGAGMTDAEGVERIWAAANGKAYATREMHMDTRHSALEDHFDHHNWCMNLRLRFLLPKRYMIAKEELVAQEVNHAHVSAGVSPEVLAGWMEMIRAWHAQEKVLLKDKTVMNPCLSTWREDDITEKKIRDKLAAEEQAELGFQG